LNSLSITIAINVELQALSPTANSGLEAKKGKEQADQDLKPPATRDPQQFTFTGRSPSAPLARAGLFSSGTERVLMSEDLDATPLL
jgi:hypothetical protein